MFWGPRFNYDASRQSRSERIKRAGYFVSPPPARSSVSASVSSASGDDSSDWGERADVLISQQQNKGIPIGDWSPPSSTPSTGRLAEGEGSKVEAEASLDEASVFTEATGASLMHYLSDPDDAGDPSLVPRVLLEADNEDVDEDADADTDADADADADADRDVSTAGGSATGTSSVFSEERWLPDLARSRQQTGPRPYSQGSSRRRQGPSLSSVVAAKFVLRRMHKLVAAASSAASALDELMEEMAREDMKALEEQDGGEGEGGGGRIPGWAAAENLSNFDPQKWSMPTIRPRSN